MTRYEYWEHLYGEKYLIRLDDANLITGVCGPLLSTGILATNFHNYDYDAQPQHTAWVRDHAAEFHPVASTNA